MRKFLIILAAIVLVVIGVFVGRTLLHPFAKVNVWEIGQIERPENFDKYIARLSRGIQIPTVSNVNIEKTNFKEFTRFRDYLKKEYPIIFKNMEYTIISDHTMVFIWRGKNPDLNPILFNAHYDTVPAGDANSWKYPPFSGTVADDRIYGRGTLDMKGMLFALLNASESLIENGFQPERDIYFVFGHDEEVDSKDGAMKVAEYLHSKGLHFDATYDEGGWINLSEIGGKKYGFGVIGVAEKGYLTIRINVRANAWHSSMPPRHTAFGDAAVIMQRLENNQMPAKILPVFHELFASFGGAFGFPARVVIANPVLLNTVGIKILSGIQSTNAFIRTTTALIGASGDFEADNVLPLRASIMVNFRLLPGDTIQDIIRHVEKQCRGFNADIEIVSGWEASKISPTNTRGFEKMTGAITEIFPSANVAPFITIGGTDSRNYKIISDNVYRFLPVALGWSEGGIHGYDESISLDNYARMILYFKSLMQDYDK